MRLGVGLAAPGDHLETMKVLIAGGADPSLKAQDVAVGLAGRTQPEVVDVTQFLADRGAKLDEMNAANRTPISLADGLPVDLAVDLLTKLISESGSKPKIPSKR